MIKLYDYELSGNCYKLRLLMSILGVDYKTVPVDFYPAGNTSRMVLEVQSARAIAGNRRRRACAA